jgi:hypothetical protein
MAPGWSCLLALALLLSAPVAIAQQADVDALATQLANAKDFRVRTQAALALGASRSKRAVQPLCGGLADESSTVRAASAAALGKLKQGGLDCLRRQLAAEEKDSVKAIIERSIARVGAGSGPAITPQTKYLVALEAVDDTGHGGDAVLAAFHRGVSAAAKPLPEFAVLPPGQPLDAVQQMLTAHPGVRGFLLSAKISARYADGTLTVKIDTAIFTLPERNLQGTFSRTLSMQGVSGADRAAEDQLILAGATRSMETFVPLAPKFR